MNSKQIWTFNFATSILLLVVILIGGFFSTGSGRDVIIVYFSIFIALYIGLMINLFYNKIHQWGTQNKNSFFIASSIMIIFSLGILYSNFIESGQEFSFRLVLLSIGSALNVVTYFWGMLKIKSIKQ